MLHSNGLQERDYVYIDDVIALCEIVMECENMNNEIINVASGTTYSVRAIYEIVADLLRTQTKPIFTESKNFWNKYEELYEGVLKLPDSLLDKEVNKYALGDNTKAKSLGWNPRFSMQEGLQECIVYAKKLFGEKS